MCRIRQHSFCWDHYVPVEFEHVAAFFLLGEVVEYGETEQIFSMPKEKKTEDYITGRFG